MYRGIITKKPLISSFCLLPFVALATACGGGDSTPGDTDAASGAEVNAAIRNAEAEANIAADVAEARQENEANALEAESERTSNAAIAPTIGGANAQ